VVISVNILGLGLKMHSMMIFVTVRDLSLPLMDKVDVKQCVNFNYVKSVLRFWFLKESVFEVPKKKNANGVGTVPMIKALGSCRIGRKPCSRKNLYFGDMSDSFPSRSGTTRTDVL
jgi:hypothetical protein